MKTAEGGGKALRLRLSEQYIEAVDDILRESSVLMVPDDDSGSGDITSPKNIAQILATYQHLSGGRKSSALSETLMAGNDTELL